MHRLSINNLKPLRQSFCISLGMVLLVAFSSAKAHSKGQAVRYIQVKKISRYPAKNKYQDKYSVDLMIHQQRGTRGKRAQKGAKEMQVSLSRGHEQLVGSGERGLRIYIGIKKDGKLYFRESEPVRETDIKELAIKTSPVGKGRSRFAVKLRLPLEYDAWSTVQGKKQVLEPMAFGARYEIDTIGSIVYRKWHKPNPKAGFPHPYADRTAELLYKPVPRGRPLRLWKVILPAEEKAAPNEKELLLHLNRKGQPRLKSVVHLDATTWGSPL